MNMNRIFRNSLLMFAVGALAVSCADYNETDDFRATTDPTHVEPYKDLAPVKSYIDRATYPNMTLGATLKVSDFNKQELAHAAAVANFDNITFGTTLMSGTIINEKGVMNFLDMSDLLDHVEEIGYDVYGSPLFGNANQADKWLSRLTAPIEIPVDYVEGKVVNYNDSTKFNGTIEKGKASIVTYDSQKVLQVGTLSNIRIIEGFEVDSLAKYTVTFWAKADKPVSYSICFSGNQPSEFNKTENKEEAIKYTLKATGNWTKVVFEIQSKPGETEGYFRIDNTRTAPIYIQKVQVGYYPDNHRPQTAQERLDTIHHAINSWCDGFMKINKGRITSFDLIDEPIDAKAELADHPGIFDLKHSTEKIFWQDEIGSENYAQIVSNAASAAFEKYQGDPAKLKFFISETGLEDQQKFESLKYWLDVWKSAKIDGINAKLNLTYSEDAATQQATEANLNKMLDNLASTGKLIRLSNLDIKYQDAEGLAVTADKITEAQRQQLADFYGYVIKSYLAKIAKDKQAGICKSNLVDTSDPVGLWSNSEIDNKHTKDWVRTATYKAFCDALSGK